MTRAAHRSFLPAAYICLRGRFYRFMLIDENGCFYLDDGTYPGDDYESIAVSILTGAERLYISESGMFYAENYPNEPFAVTDDMYLLMQWVLLH